MIVCAQVQSYTGLFNVSSPAPNAPYVASRILPCVYTVASIANKKNLQLSISLSNGTRSIIIEQAADITPGYSFERNIGGATVFEHQFNYPIPINTTAGSYQVTFIDYISKTNLTIPITIGAAPPTLSVVTPSASSSRKPVHSSLLPATIQNSSDGNTLDISKKFLFVVLLLATVNF